MSKLTNRFKKGWNIFLNKIQQPFKRYRSYGYSTRPDRIYLTINSARSILNSIYNRIAVDVSELDIRHVRLNDEGMYQETIKSDLSYVLGFSANLDQTGKELIQESVMIMFTEGCVAFVPTDFDDDPGEGSEETYKIYEVRVGKIMQWYPDEVLVSVYNEMTGRTEEVLISKNLVAIVENPFYAIMNEPNSTLQRLTLVLNQLDKINDQCSAGKMDMIIQLPYSIRTDDKYKIAEGRRKDLEKQMSGSQFGIGFIGAEEHVIQLNRPIENNLWEQAKDLLSDLYNQLGLTQSIFDGTADEQTMLNYNNRTVGVIIWRILNEMERKWLSKTARTQGQALRVYRDPFKLIPMGQLAELSDKLTRNEIFTSNEVRTSLGFKPSKDPNANKLQNANINHPNEETTKNIEVDEISKSED